jgi:ATP-dependent Lon protease
VSTEILTVLPVLPIKNTVLFPNLFLPLSVGRPGSVAAVEACLASEDKTMLVVAQRDGGSDTITREGLFGIGTRAVVKRMVRGPGALELIVQGTERMEIVGLEQTEPYVKASVRTLAFT